MNRKRTKEILSIACAVIGAILVFLMLFLGLHWNIFLCMLLCTGIYAALLLIFKPSDKIGRIDISNLNNGELLHEKLSEAGNDFSRMKKSVKAIRDPELSRQCHELLDVADSIIRYLTKNPQKIASARRYIDYYQETAANIIGQYVELQDTRMTAEEMKKALHKKGTRYQQIGAPYTWRNGDEGEISAPAHMLKARQWAEKQVDISLVSY